jgi:hypothetical protein
VNPSQRVDIANTQYRNQKAPVHNTELPSGNAKMLRVFHFEVSISALRLDPGSKSQQIQTLARAKSIWNFQPLGTKVGAILVDFSDALGIKPVR